MTTHSSMQKEPNSIHHPNMKKTCEICSDSGIQEAIITCYQWKNVDVHHKSSLSFKHERVVRYCVLGYREDAPVEWCCEECDIQKGVIFSPRGLENKSFKESKLHASIKIRQSTVQPKKHNKFPQRQHINWEKDVQIGKKRYLPVEEALDFSSCIKNYGSPPINFVPSRIVSTKSRKFRKPKGSLKLAPGIFNCYIQAHPPCIVRSEVYELSGLLPDTLKLQLVPQGNIWPSLFENYYSGKEDIGLYFFRSERKRSERYIDLVEFIHNKGLVMRTLINDVELFILASTTLCNDSQRGNNEHFL